MRTGAEDNVREDGFLTREIQDSTRPGRLSDGTLPIVHGGLLLPSHAEGAGDAENGFIDFCSPRSSAPSA